MSHIAVMPHSRSVSSGPGSRCSTGVSVRSGSRSTGGGGGAGSRRVMRDLEEASAALRHTAPDLQGGTWFSSGFYGHHRSKVRNDIDFQHTVRQRMMPHPPACLERKSQISAQKHPFSEHDNKHTYCNEGLYFGNGMGKKKVAGRGGKFEAEFLHCRATQAGRDMAQARSQSSTGGFVSTGGRRSAAMSPAAGWATAGEWDLDGPQVQTRTHGHLRALTAPARLYQPPVEVPEERLMESCYQKTFCRAQPQRAGRTHSSMSARSSSSQQLPAVYSSSRAVSLVQSRDPSRPATPPPASQSPAAVVTLGRATPSTAAPASPPPMTSEQ